MVQIRNILAAGFVASVLAGAAVAQDADPLAELMAQLADPENDAWESVEDRVIDHWSRSGSRSVDLLLQRGRDALEDEDLGAAIEHFTAATDHAPDFAEAWNMRATAFFLMDELGLSIGDISRTLALNPNHFGALNGLGVIMEELGDKKAALAAYRASYALNPHRESLSEAIARLEKAVEGVDI